MAFPSQKGKVGNLIAAGQNWFKPKLFSAGVPMPGLQHGRFK